MTPPSHPGRVWPPLSASLVVVLVLATIGSFAVTFGLMTSCTTTFSCTATSCSPCATTNAWLTAGWIGQGALLLVGVALAVLAVRRARLRGVRAGATLLGPLAIALFVVTTALAARSS
ncbi:hypothetical protein [Blastococcus brunescens]|uniref:Integral membrane protein n=1 Tax=Blastococcus brunescens TaxID=1564165 RepID=A0ABZ1B0P2_9ACTN|nr:hypothetical protein [Blastococcus sp. BMG 8361]WRL63947.1 hypothetical protein U6N30_30845 [Blastococcus sp. BMG 8361]